MKNADNISEFTIYRLSIYKRCLEQLEQEQFKTVSSKDFAARFGLNSAQVRKDLAYFGEFGIRGMGYPISTLKEQILTILGLAESSSGQKTWKAVLIGAGKIGTALLKYQHFAKYGFEIVAAFDADPESSEYARQPQATPVGTVIPLYPLDQLEQSIAEHSADMAILATSEENAQEVVDRVVATGIHGILNFVPVQLIVPSDVKVRTIDIIAELQCLTYHLHREAVAEAEEDRTTLSDTSPK
ncbi:redox-sensing transcriptional repressor Rex [candidate division KSB3 bacterium]|uniref:Redox-sensing transcriptional repressor Rex n=1 Tax=candidate division KSB3 bacterium TaxID=2044937 RepID=A0A2G6KCU1_9BACT|nr:MAG: redox-sensing transcriptional repressor Rex [candidate division KSB3 bacterium]